MVIGTATTVKEAIEIERAGLDMVILQGSEAGGHRGTFLHTEEEGLIGLMALILKPFVSFIFRLLQLVELWMDVH